MFDGPQHSWFIIQRYRKVRQPDLHQPMAPHTEDTEENSLDSGCFDKQQVPTFQPGGAQGTVAAGLEATHDSEGPLLQLENSSVGGCVSLALP